jgi:hypothetical protein
MGQMRSRIMEDFTEKDLDYLSGLISSPYFDNNNDKADAILHEFRGKNFIELAPATNRFALLKGKYVYKFALDEYGVKDNINEFEMSEELQPYVTKTYETNGLITIAEYVNLISQKQFEASKENIRAILEELSDRYIFSDIGTIPRNFCNWGYRDNDQLVILDYGYIWKKDPKIMFCHRNNCYGKLQYTENYDMFYCTKCVAKYDIIDFIYRMDISEEAYKENLKYKDMGELVIGIGAPSGFVKYNTTGGHS